MKFDKIAAFLDKAMHSIKRDSYVALGKMTYQNNTGIRPMAPGSTFSIQSCLSRRGILANSHCRLDYGTIALRCKGNDYGELFISTPMNTSAKIWVASKGKSSKQQRKVRL